MIDRIRASQTKDALLQDLYEMRGRIPLSFEVFPPKSSEQCVALHETVDRLTPLAGRGFSVTMSSGGATRDRTVDTATAIATRTGRPVMAHMVSLGLSRDEVLNTADG